MKHEEKTVLKNVDAFALIQAIGLAQEEKKPKHGKRKMGNEQIIDIEKALDEKRTMQKNFIREHDCPSPMLSLLIEHFEGMKKRKGTEQ